METNDKGMQNRDDLNANEQKRTDRRDGTEETDLGFDRDVSGNDIVEKGMEERRHHQQFGNRKYESYTNHSSADDQPMNDSGA
ncbi:hypothetical protein FNO01nite_24500 [Flavobacterium noncentrifugens]|uniref:Uncharacterized protein n=1 Tax=Flavobacterium noncentrifugens TaxID=1128970 RepID=A0A1G9A1N9_9FLAO|nr:hypothetical protein [Flavobacterium noncentrifugens]GEP51778.1 hypothetical protein FNO01nite_24500 [Flavobacterium noncentrifugens]SDK20310.1 hypothetical protein SAMN04487935_2803 [Flavobacterium noncentrifugens]